MDIPKPTRICSVSGTELKPGNVFFSLLVEEGNGVKRTDFLPENWTVPETEFLGWWKSKIPEVHDKKVRLAPNDILLNLFDQLALQPENADMRYVLALLLIRRRLLRYEREECDENGRKTLVVYGIKENATYEVPMALPDRQRLEEVQMELAQLLYS